MRRLFFGLLTALLLTVTVASSAFAYTIREGSRPHIAPDEVIEDDLILTGDMVLIEGTVNGDVFAFADYVEVRGKINGTLVTAANSVHLLGSVTGSVFAAGNTVEVDGRIDGSLTSAGSTTRVTERGSVGRGWINVADRMDLNGKVERGVLAGASRISVQGSVGRELIAVTEDLFIRRSAVIGGPVTYTSDHLATVEEGARTGEVTYKQYEGDELDFGWTAYWLAFKFSGFVLAGLAFLALFPSLRRRFPELVQAKPWEMPVAGLVALVAVPVGSVLLLVTVVGIPFAVFSLLAFPWLIYLSQILVALGLGRVLADRVGFMKDWSWPLLFLTGALLTTALVELPGVGWVFGLIWLVYGLGGLFFLIPPARRAVQESR